MAITDAEADEAFRFLSGALREAGFDWVMTQVEEKLAFGKVHAKKIRAREFPEATVSFTFLDEPRRAIASKSTSAVFAVSERFSPQEQLGVLLDGIDVAIPVVTEVVSDVFLNLRELGVESRLEFAPEAEIGGAFTVALDDAQHHVSAGEHLKSLVNELRQQLEHADQT